MKPLTETFDQADIDAILANKAEESPYLEFKRADSYTKVDIAGKVGDDAKHEISRDVSAFANSDGGILIYGIAEANHVADSLSPIDGNIFTKERLEQLIADKIKRSIIFYIDSIRYSGNFSQSIYVVRIPRSSSSPHQASDGKFYKRGNFRKEVMREWEIRDSYNRPTKTELKILDPIIKGGIRHGVGERVVTYNATIEFQIQNIGKAIEIMYKLEVMIPHEISRVSNEPGYLQDFFKAKSITEENYDIYSIPHETELYQNEKLRMAIVTLILSEKNVMIAQHYPIKMKLYFSSGFEEKEFLLLPYLQHQPSRSSSPHPLELECFQDKRRS